MTPNMPNHNIDEMNKYMGVDREKNNLRISGFGLTMFIKVK